MSSKYPPKIFSKSFEKRPKTFAKIPPKPSQNPPTRPPKIPPNPSKNRLEILPKSIQNILKSLQHRSQNRCKIPNAPESAPNSIFSIFYGFWEPQGPPKIKPKSLKPEKTRENPRSKEHHISQTIFH